MEQNDNQELEIDLKEIFVVLLDRIWIIIFSGIVLALLSAVYTKVLVTPMYTSTTKLYVINRQNDDNVVTYSDLQTGSGLTQDYLVQVTGMTVMNRVISELNLPMTTQQLASRVSASNPTNSRFIVITVQDADPVVAQQIAQCIGTVSASVAEEVMDIEKVNIAEAANLPIAPSSPNLKKNVVIGGAAGVVLAAAIIIIIFLLNDNIRNSEDIKKYLDLNTLGQIPMLSSENEKKKKKKRAKRQKMDIDDIEDDDEDSEETVISATDKKSDASDGTVIAKATTAVQPVVSDEEDGENDEEEPIPNGYASYLDDEDDEVIPDGYASYLEDEDEDEDEDAEEAVVVASDAHATAKMGSADAYIMKVAADKVNAEEKTVKTEKKEKAEKKNKKKSENNDKSEKKNKTEKLDKTEKNVKPEKKDKPGKKEKPVKKDKSEKKDKTEKTGKIEKKDKSGKKNKPTNPDKKSKSEMKTTEPKNIM